MGYSKQEQAFRAKDSALEKMAKQDFSGAKKLALMARKLDPNLEDIVHVILVCDVHARGGGEDEDEDERDWYKILDVDPKADEDSIRNQYNRLALNLHPDKIRLPGSGEAFRLVCQAKAVLTDDGRRRSYDGRRKSKKLLEDSWRSDLGFSGFKNDDKSQDSGFVEGSLNIAKDLGFAKFRNAGFAGFRNGPGPFGNTGSAQLQEPSGFATFQTRPGPFDRCYLSNLNGGDGNEKAEDSGFTAYRNGPGPIYHDLSSNSKGAAGNANVQDSGFAKNIQNGLGPFDICYGNNLRDRTPNAKAQDSGFTKHGNGSSAFDHGSANLKDSAFQNGSGPSDHGSLNNTKDGDRIGKLHDLGFTKIQNGPGPSDQEGVSNNIQDGNGNARLQNPSISKIQNGPGLYDQEFWNVKNRENVNHAEESGFTTFQNGPGPLDRGILSNSNGAAGNEKLQDSGFAKNIQNGPGPFDIGYGSNSKDGSPNAEVHDSGFRIFQNGSDPLDLGLASNLQGVAGNANVQDSGFARNIRNGSGPFDISNVINSKDGTLNAKVQDSGFTKHGNGSSEFDHGSANDLRNAELQDSDFMTFQNGPDLIDRGLASNLKSGAGNANVQDLGLAKNIQNGPGPFDICYGNNSEDGTPNAKVHDSGFTKHGNRSGAFDHGSLNNTKDGDRNGNVHDSCFPKIQNGPDPSHQEGVSNKTLVGNGNAELQNPSISKIQNGAGPSDENQETVKKNADVSKPKENMKKKVPNSGVEPQFLINPGANPQFPGTSVTPTSARAIPNLKYLDSELNDFEKGREKERFRPGQIWAVYDTLDAMPRFYAFIKKLISSDDFKVHITWLEPSPENEMEKKWLFKGLPASCGRFKLGESEVINDLSIFSHLANSENGFIRTRSNTYRVYPRKGETWAVFKNWKMDWEMKNANEEFEFDFVEIVSSYSDDLGVRVGFLVKVKGFSTIFSRVNVEEEVEIVGKDKLRFSHRVSSFRMKSLNGSSMFFELDPASLPEDSKGLGFSEISTISEIFN